jgi:hypothetical protein
MNPDPDSVPLAEALSAMANEIISIDKTLGTQFRVFKSSVSEIYKNVQADKQMFNSARVQQMPNADGLTPSLEKEALDITGSGMYYGRKVGAVRKIRKNQLFEHATKCGISKYI